MEEMRSDRDRLESNRTPRFRADETGDKVTEGVTEREKGSQFWKVFWEDLQQLYFREKKHFHGTCQKRKK
jgi:hypothetical protein